MALLDVPDYVRARTGGHDEAFLKTGAPRATYRPLLDGLRAYGDREFERRRGLVDLLFRTQGITFTVYGDPQGTERPFPFDPVPRVLTASTWARIDAGVKQRVHALNLFLADVYGEQQALADGIIPRSLVLDNPAYRREVHGIQPLHGAFTHVVGCDLIRDGKGTWRVLEDNLRCPSGVSYMLANRGVMARAFPKLLGRVAVQPIQHYTVRLLDTLRSLSPRDVAEPTVALLTPGPFNSAYFEHAYLARQMGIELVEGRDLLVDEGRVWMRTTRGRRQVDVIYRRIDDDFLDPAAFRPDSMLGVRGLLDVYRAGRVALANAIGTGVADDKAVYAYTPDLIRYYLGEEPILPIVPTLLGSNPDDARRMQAEADRLVIKRVDGAGGYDMLIGDRVSEEERTAFLKRVKRDPAKYIAQPILNLSTHPTYATDTGRFEPRHVDLRPFLLLGETSTLVPGGLTRVALKRGSLVVNSSQGGGSKDTWVLERSAEARAR